MEEFNKIVRKLFICKCENTEHQIIFSYIIDDNDREVYMDTYLSPEYNIFKRIWLAIKYIFGYTSKYGHFDEFIFKKEDAKELQKIVDYLEECV